MVPYPYRAAQEIIQGAENGDRSRTPEYPQSAIHDAKRLQENRIRNNTRITPVAAVNGNGDIAMQDANDVNGSRMRPRQAPYADDTQVQLHAQIPRKRS